LLTLTGSRDRHGQNVGGRVEKDRKPEKGHELGEGLREGRVGKEASGHLRRWGYNNESEKRRKKKWGKIKTGKLNRLVA